jgi:micrococcal nuclease
MQIRIKLKKDSLFRSLLLVVVFLVFSLTKKNIDSSNKKAIIPSPTISLKQNNVETYKVTKIIDGDTIEIETGEKVRYIGVDTPELHHPQESVQCFGYEAMIKNKQLVEGKSVSLEKDISEVDKYKRLLRYVFLADEAATKTATFINEVLVREGYARLATYPPDIKYQNIFLQAEKQARENKRGLWSRCD